MDNKERAVSKRRKVETNRKEQVKGNMQKWILKRKVEKNCERSINKKDGTGWTKVDKKGRSSEKNWIRKKSRRKKKDIYQRGRAEKRMNGR